MRAVRGRRGGVAVSELYTSSRLRVLRDCLRRHFYRYTLGVLTPQSPAMLFGTVVHAALEAYFVAWKLQRLDERLPDALKEIEHSQLSQTDQVRARILVIAYHLRWGGEPWEIVAVEAEFRYELAGHLIGGKLDALIRDTRDGRVYVLEHKTTRQEASPGSVYWDRLSIDGQVSIYVDGATMLGHEIAGCIYDVLKTPEHEPKLATPPDQREYTQGKGCKKCGGSAKPGEIVQGRGFYTVSMVTVEEIKCEECDGTGWKKNKEGVPEAPRLYSRFRETDETPEEFEERVLAEIAERPDDFLIRSIVVRLDDELPRMRRDLADTIALHGMAVAAFGDEPPRNPDACAKFNSLCPYFAACAGRASIDDQHQFPRGATHPELASAA